MKNLRKVSFSINFQFLKKNQDQRVQYYRKFNIKNINRLILEKVLVLNQKREIQKNHEKFFFFFECLKIFCFNIIFNIK